MADWASWHAQYEDPSSPLSQRLAAVQQQITLALDRAAPGPLRLLSLCAGKGRDVLPVLATHPRGRDVRGRLVELDPDLASAARASAPPSVEVLEADAGTTAASAGAVPADLLLLCGIFGNVPDEDVARTVAAVPSLLPPAARSSGPGTGASPTSLRRCARGSPPPASRKPRSSPRQCLAGRSVPACCGRLPRRWTEPAGSSASSRSPPAAQAPTSSSVLPNTVRASMAACASAAFASG
jgi:hypothetical protein